MLTLEETIELIRKHLPEYDRKAIMEMVNERRQELGPEVVNEESAAMLVARELGIDLQQVTARSRQKIEDVSETDRSVSLTAKVVRIGTISSFSKKDGGDGKVTSITIADETGQIRVALWDEMTRVVSEGAISIGDIIQIRGAYVKKGIRDKLELNLGRNGGIKIFEKDEIEDLDIDVGEVKATPINELGEDMYELTLTVKVERKFKLSTFTRKSDGTEGKVLSMIVGDDTGTTRLVFWDEHADLADEMKEGEVIRVSGAMTKTGRNEGEIEVHLNRNSTIERNLKIKIEVTEERSTAPPAESLGRLTIKDMKVGMRDVDIEAKVLKIFPVNEFDRDGETGQVQNIVVADESGKSVRVAFWHEDVEKIKKLSEGDVIRVKHGYVKKGYRDDIEFGVGRNAEIEINPKGSKLASMDIKATESGTSAEPQGRMKIEDMTVGMRDVDIEGKVYKIFPPNQFERDGEPGKVQNIIIADESGKTIRAAFWNDDVDEIKDLSEGDVIRVTHGYIKKGYRDDIEFGVGKSSKIEVNPKGSKLKDLKIEGERYTPVVVGQRTLISDIDEDSEGSTLEVCGIIVAVGQNSPVYPACPECRKKVEFGEDSFVCKEHGNVEPEYRMLYKITIDDGSGPIRATLFGKAGEELLGMTAEEAQKLIDKSKNDKAPIERNSDRILGSYVVVKGRVTKYRDSLDITASDLSFADPVKEIARMKESVESYLDN
ncbi:MAG: OB-fold nucleic acid binding domain-containing protein [Candidatus Thorarchaeota archaeon]